jgi:apolipoprotein D and lipocalin family protein
MSRDSELSDADYQELLDYAAGVGYDSDKVQRVPQRWPAKERTSIPQSP